MIEICNSISCKILSEVTKFEVIYHVIFCWMTCSYNVGSVVAQWLVHLPLVLDAGSLIPARDKKCFGVQTLFPLCHLHERH